MRFHNWGSDEHVPTTLLVLEEYETDLVHRNDSFIRVSSIDCDTTTDAFAKWKDKREETFWWQSIFRKHEDCRRPNVGNKSTINNDSSQDFSTQKDKYLTEKAIFRLCSKSVVVDFLRTGVIIKVPFNKIASVARYRNVSIVGDNSICLGILTRCVITAEPKVISRLRRNVKPYDVANGLWLLEVTFYETVNESFLPLLDDTIGSFESGHPHEPSAELCDEDVSDGVLLQHYASRDAGSSARLFVELCFKIMSRHVRKQRSNSQLDPEKLIESIKDVFPNPLSFPEAALGHRETNLTRIYHSENKPSLRAERLVTAATYRCLICLTDQALHLLPSFPQSTLCTIYWTDVRCVFPRIVDFKPQTLSFIHVGSDDTGRNVSGACWGELNLVFQSIDDYNTVIRILGIVKSGCFISNERRTALLKEATSMWHNWQMDTFHYLLLLNGCAGRSLEDFSQYFVFPWTYINFVSDTVDLNNEKNFRDFAMPIGAQNPTSFTRLKMRFEELQQLVEVNLDRERNIETAAAATGSYSSSPSPQSELYSSASPRTNSLQNMLRPIPIEGDETEAKIRKLLTTSKIPLFLFGSHYSTAAYTAYWLVRKLPEVQLRFQRGRFDVWTRLFNCVNSSWEGLSRDGSSASFMELIPEFYQHYDSSFLENKLNVTITSAANASEKDLGPRSGVLGHVEIPKWAPSRGDSAFLKVLREALECDVVSQRIHLWIDLIFGVKQWGAPAFPDNLYHPLTYLTSLMAREMHQDAQDILATFGFTQSGEAIRAQAREFGQCPVQLFTAPHIPRLSRAEAAEKLRRAIPSPEYTNLESLVSFPRSAEPWFVVHPLESLLELPNVPDDPERLKGPSVGFSAVEKALFTGTDTEARLQQSDTNHGRSADISLAEVSKKLPSRDAVRFKRSVIVNNLLNGTNTVSDHCGSEVTEKQHCVAAWDIIGSVVYLGTDAGVLRKYNLETQRYADLAIEFSPVTAVTAITEETAVLGCMSGKVYFAYLRINGELAQLSLGGASYLYMPPTHHYEKVLILKSSYLQSSIASAPASQCDAAPASQPGCTSRKHVVCSVSKDTTLRIWSIIFTLLEKNIWSASLADDSIVHGFDDFVCATVSPTGLYVVAATVSAKIFLWKDPLTSKQPVWSGFIGGISSITSISAESLENCHLFSLGCMSSQQKAAAYLNDASNILDNRNVQSSDDGVILSKSAPSIVGQMVWDVSGTATRFLKVETDGCGFAIAVGIINKGRAADTVRLDRTEFSADLAPVSNQSHYFVSVASLVQPFGANIETCRWPLQLPVPPRTNGSTFTEETSIVSYPGICYYRLNNADECFIAPSRTWHLHPFADRVGQAAANLCLLPNEDDRGSSYLQILSRFGVLENVY